ncbi:MAG: sugar kinase [Candidatus Brocadiae bacterium]|nr:sugar kinase [Candidatus Brocadiia bacterium]
MGKVVTFGEIMGRLTPPGFLRFRQAMPGQLEVTFAGSEANVAASLAMFGGRACFVTALPRNAVADACVCALRGLGIDTSRVLRTDEGRLGLYFLETGANQRPSQVIYDREGSAISRTPAGAYGWKDIFADADWFHVSGITPAISRLAAEAALAALKEARDRGLTVSCDLNFRKKLWRWDPDTPPRELAERTMRQVLPFVDLVIANEEDAADVLSIKAEDTDVEAGKLAVDRYPEVARAIAGQFPNVTKVGITLRESISASHNNWGAMLYDAADDAAYFAPTRDGRYEPYAVRNIVDRVGAGDSFAAGLIYSFTTPELSDPAAAVSFATAASCLAHSISGDTNFSSRAEVEALMGGSGAGRVVR